MPVMSTRVWYLIPALAAITVVLFLVAVTSTPVRTGFTPAPPVVPQLVGR